jgi:hypothetical protein
MPEASVPLSSEELNYLIGAITYLNEIVKLHIENHTQVDGNELYAKLFDAWEALETND